MHLLPFLTVLPWTEALISSTLTCGDLRHAYGNECCSSNDPSATASTIVPLLTLLNNTYLSGIVPPLYFPWGGMEDKRSLYKFRVLDGVPTLWESDAWWQRECTYDTNTGEVFYDQCYTYNSGKYGRSRMKVNFVTKEAYAQIKDFSYEEMAAYVETTPGVQRNIFDTIDPEAYKNGTAEVLNPDFAGEYNFDATFFDPVPAGVQKLHYMESTFFLHVEGTKVEGKIFSKGLMDRANDPDFDWFGGPGEKYRTPAYGEWPVLPFGLGGEIAWSSTVPEELSEMAAAFLEDEAEWMAHPWSNVQEKLSGKYFALLNDVRMWSSGWAGGQRRYLFKLDVPSHPSNSITADFATNTWIEKEFNYDSETGQEMYNIKMIPSQTGYDAMKINLDTNPSSEVTFKDLVTDFQSGSSTTQRNLYPDNEWTLAFTNLAEMQHVYHSGKISPHSTTPPSTIGYMETISTTQGSKIVTITCDKDVSALTPGTPIAIYYNGSLPILNGIPSYLFRTAGGSIPYDFEMEVRTSSGTTLTLEMKEAATESGTLSISGSVRDQPNYLPPTIPQYWDEYTLTVAMIENEPYLKLLVRKRLPSEVEYPGVFRAVLHWATPGGDWFTEAMPDPSQITNPTWGAPLTSDPTKDVPEFDAASWNGWGERNHRFYALTLVGWIPIDYKLYDSLEGVQANLNSTSYLFKDEETEYTPGSILDLAPAFD